MYTMSDSDGLAPSRGTRRWAAFTSLLAPALKGHAILFAVLAAHIAFAAGIVAVTPGLRPPGPAMLLLSFASVLGIILPLSIVSLRFYHLATKVRPKHPIPALVRDILDFLRQPNRMANALPVVAVFVVFTTVFTYLKGAVPLVQPFAWDMTFMEWDRWLHFGYDPWRLLQPLLGYPAVTHLITYAYHLWFMVMWLMIVGLAFARAPSVLRMQFFLAFMLTWGVGGNVLAIVFSSAGPCYYSLIGLSPDPFAPLMAYLYKVHEATPLWAVDTQQMLWQGYQGDGLRLGISAMPSMHNAAILLSAFAGWRMNRSLGMVLYACVILIFLGSVHLGWHYAIDAYAGWAIALLAWWGAGAAARRWETTGWARDYSRASSACRPQD